MLSIVIPTLNAADRVGACLKSLIAARQIIQQIIVCDGGSTDSTLDICSAAGAHILHSPAGRGRQLRTAASAVASPWLLFLHADTRLAEGWQRIALNHINTRPNHAACFRLVFDSSAWQARCLEALVAVRVALLALPYGDQGLLIPTSLYRELGGFADLPLMEDVQLIRRIGKKRLKRLDCPAITSADKYLRHGWIRQSTRNAWIMMRYALGADPAELARLYRR